jgi:type VI secretion system protein ImpB
VAFPVENTLTGEGNLMVDITFESMEDFSPAAVARKVEPLRKLLEARTQLANLMTWMDGKQGAEDLIGKLLRDKETLQAMVSTPAPPQPASPPPAASAEPAPLPPAPEPEPMAAADYSSSESSGGSDDLDDLLGSLGGDEDK